MLREAFDTTNQQRIRADKIARGQQGGPVVHVDRRGECPHVAVGEAGESGYASENAPSTCVQSGMGAPR